MKNTYLIHLMMVLIALGWFFGLVIAKDGFGNASASQADADLIRQLAIQRDKELLTDSPDMDFSQPVVSRGFAADTVERATDKISAQAYRQGQIAYFFGRYQHALHLWQPLAEAGFADAQASIGWMYQTGLGVDIDYQMAIKWYRLAARQDNAVAQNNLGVMFEKGILVRTDLSQARYWYRQSAAQGYRFAQYNLANQLLQVSAQKNANEIKNLLKLATEQGVVQASEQLQMLSRQKYFE